MPFKYYQITCNTCRATYWQNKELVDTKYPPKCYKNEKHKDLNVILLSEEELERALKGED